MAYDLLAVGGTGQAVLLELLYRAERTGLELLPRKIWILDRDLDTWWDLIEAQKELLSRTGTQAPSMAITKARPAVPKGAAAQTMSTVLDGNFEPPPNHLPGTIASVVTEALTPPEWIQNIADGFFALPRLAAAWFGIVGLEARPEFLEKSYLTTTIDDKNDPLFVVGSVAGGTGAGLLPSLLHAFRLDEPRLWKREIWIFPLLPYFDPQESARADKRINLVQCRWNGAHAIQELERERALLHARLEREVPDEAQRALVPGTSISLIPPLEDPADLQHVPPPDPRQIALRKFFDGAIGRGVDHILAVDAYLSNPKKTLGTDPANRTHLGVLQIPPGPSNSSSVAYRGGSRNGIVSEMIRTHLTVVQECRKPVRAIPGVVAGSGLGRTTERLFHALTLAKKNNPEASDTTFWERFDARLSERADAISAITTALHTAQDRERIIALIDRYFDKESRRKEVLRTADSNDPQRGSQVADRIADALLSEAESESAQVLRNTSHNALIPAVVFGNVSISSFGQVPVFGEFLSPKEAASAWSSRWRPVEDPRSFHGSSRARLMGHAHAYADYVSDATVGGGAPGIETPLGVAWLLWKAAVVGLLEFEEHEIGAPRGERWREAEDWGTDFGGHVVVMTYQGTPIGFSSADMGIVPAAQLSDRPQDSDWKPDARSKTALETLRESVAAIEKSRVEAGLESLANVLNAFSREYSTQTDTPPWQKLLLYEARPGTADNHSLLAKMAIPSQRLWLRLKKNDPPVEIRIPLVVDAFADVRKIAYAKVDEPSKPSWLLSWEKGVLYYHRGEEKLPLLHTCRASGDGKRYVSRFTVELRRATEALQDPDESAESPIFELAWPPQRIQEVQR